MKLQALLITIVSMVFVVGCGKQSSKNSGSTKYNRVQQGQAYTGTTSCPANSWGRIYDNNSNEQAFQQKVADFSLRNISDIGTISPYYNANTGIEFQMTLRFQNGQMASGSMASFKITDSYTHEGSGVISFQLPQSYSGQGYNGQINAAVADGKGYVRFQGSRVNANGQQVWMGQVYYNNGYSENYLGEFVISSCAVVGA